MTQLLSHAQAARFYDLLGARLDTQAFYETAALHDLVANLELARCQSVVEFGIGTGRLAAELLSTHLPPDATYLGLDVSATMVRLATNRLRQFGERAKVRPALLALQPPQRRRLDDMGRDERVRMNSVLRGRYGSFACGPSWGWPSEGA
jgi:SAM-dependent methyltransferase